MRMLIAYDGGDAGRRAVDAAADLATRAAATVDVVSVVPPGDRRPDAGPWDDLAAHRVLLHQAQRMLRERGIEPGLVEESGDPARTIERLGGEGGYDLIVVSPRAGTGLDRRWHASVAAHVAAHAPTSVLVVR